MILIPEPGLEYLQRTPEFFETMGEAANDAVIEGLKATSLSKEGKKQPDHKTRLLYLKEVISMNGWSGDFRMKLRSHIRQVIKDKLEIEARLNGQVPGGVENMRLTVPREARREMG